MIDQAVPRTGFILATGMAGTAGPTAHGRDGRGTRRSCRGGFWKDGIEAPDWLGRRRIVGIEAFVGVVEEPENGGGDEDDGVDGKERVPAVEIEKALVGDGGDGVANVADHVHEAKGHGGIAAADVHDVGPMAGLVHIDAIGGDAEENQRLRGCGSKSQAEGGDRGANQAGDGEESPPEKFVAGAADEKVGEAAGDEAGEAHAEHGEHGQPGMFL